MTTVTRISPEELLVLPDGKSYELVDGELKERNVSVLTSFVAGEFLRRLANFVREHGLGWVFDAENGDQCSPHEPSRVRKPDVSFVSATRLAAGEIGRGWMRIPPDLAVEVVSPGDNAAELAEKLDDYRLAGFPVVWVVYPESGIVWIRRGDGTTTDVSDPAELVGEGLLEGFRCRLDDLLPRDPESTGSNGA